MKKKWKAWISLCLAFVLGFAVLPAAVNADGEYANLKLYTGSVKVTSDMYVSDDTGTYAESVNENCPDGYQKDGYRLWRVDEANYTVCSRWISDNEGEWPAYITGYFAPENVVLVPNWVPEYSALPITAENPTVVIGDGAAQDRGDFYYQWLRERKAVDIGNYHDESEQVKVSASVNASYNSESGKWIAGNEQPYMELRLTLQRGDVVTVKNISGGTNPQHYLSGYLKESTGAAYLETYDHNNDTFYVTSKAGGECSLHMQNNINNSLQVSVTVSRYEGEDGEVGTKTYSGAAGTYCCKISYLKNGSQISFLTNSVTIKDNEAGGNEPGGNEPGGNEPGGNEPGGDETKVYAVAKGAETNGSFAPKINGKEIGEASPGQTVTVETYPAAGYKTKIITYRRTDGNSGESVTVPMGGDGNGCFVMPEYGVTVEVSFQKESSDVKPTQPPKIEISLDGNAQKWSSSAGKVSFNMIFNQAKQFKVKVTDAENDVDTSGIKYYLADRDLFSGKGNYTAQEIEAAVAGKWKDNSDTVDVRAEGRYVLYVKASDRAGNTTYANSQGLIIDTTVPVISGVTDGNKYYGKTTFTVRDTYLDTVTIDGKNVQLQNGTYAIEPDNGLHKITATDLAGNKVSCEVSVYETWVRDGIKKTGVYTLKKGTAYKLGKGKWKVVGDDTVYRGGMTIYVPTDGDYDFRKQ